MDKRVRHCNVWCRGVSWAAIVLAIAVVGTSGCAAYKATQQPDKKNLAVLSRGTPRTRVIAELGAPLASDERDGATVDLFVFKQGYSKGVKAGRALAHGAADVVTGGLWEVVGIPAEALADGTDVKVEVTYDDRRAVQSIDVIEGQKIITPRRWFARKSKAKPAADTARQNEKGRRQPPVLEPDEDAETARRSDEARASG